MSRQARDRMVGDTRPACAESGALSAALSVGMGGRVGVGRGVGWLVDDLADALAEDTPAAFVVVYEAGGIAA